METKNINFLLFLSVLILVTLACNAALPQTEDEVPRVTVEEARVALNSGQAVIVDVRNADAYAASHADGAISIPLNEFENNINSITLEKDQWIITYCT